MPDVIVEEGEILNLLKNLDVREAMKPVGVNGWILKECADQLVEPIHELNRYSLASSELPLEWKRSNIIPIYKGRDMEDPLNYRYISLTSVLCKICEHIICKRWIYFLKRNELISGKQFGFQQSKSCDTNPLRFYSRVTYVIQEREGWVDVFTWIWKRCWESVPQETPV